MYLVVYENEGPLIGPAAKEVKECPQVTDLEEFGKICLLNKRRILNVYEAKEIEFNIMFDIKLNENP